MGSPRLNDIEATTTVWSVPPLPCLLLFPCLVFPLYPYFNYSLWASPAFTSESLQTIEPLMRSDGQMERRRRASDRALADPAALELRWGQTSTVKSHLGSCSCCDRRRLSRNLDSVISLCWILFFKYLHSWLSQWVNTKKLVSHSSRLLVTSYLPSDGVSKNLGDPIYVWLFCDQRVASNSWMRTRLLWTSEIGRRLFLDFVKPPLVSDPSGKLKRGEVAVRLVLCPPATPSPNQPVLLPSLNCGRRKSSRFYFKLAASPLTSQPRLHLLTSKVLMTKRRGFYF